MPPVQFTEAASAVALEAHDWYEEQAADLGERFQLAVRGTQERIEANPNITFVESADGGHCSFVGERNGYDGHFAERAVVEFFKSLLEKPAEEGSNHQGR